ncbi:MAG: ribosomal RNA small subunit methyltransferase A [Verrucomicrobia bacterium]|nr:ribosomal RNA small subunit methyltransferase A [Verrucomicrobiota bacterium]MBU1734804.1 ribosomal RNA small subunit methyltransferase A [Verrucomicrobiota bacterium]MBU1858021.1 ribosomal RNA small subunit methyltransferase A [Verrucomicrobiota bacterium]
MKLTRISDVHAILAEWNIRPQKSLGQNFLIDANILGIMLDTAGITIGDEVLEIGTGLGVLTEPLARVARRVVTVEKDPRLWPFLKGRLKAFPNVELICGDMMKVDHEVLFRSGISKVVANLPYSVGSAILVNLIQAETPPVQLTVTLQQEVAARLTAKPGHKDFGLLTLWTQLRYDVAIRKTVSPTCFYPAPGVSSTILNLVRQERPTNDCSSDNCQADDYPARHFFYALTKFAFAHRRKQLKTILCDATIIAHSGQADLPTETHLTTEDVLAVFQKLGIDPRTRPEDLSVATWRRLAKALSAR